MSGNLEGTVHRRRGGKENESTDCVRSDIQVFSIAKDLKATVLEAQVRVMTVTAGGQR